jgi:hypothetical protein
MYCTNPDANLESHVYVSYVRKLNHLVANANVQFYVPPFHDAPSRLIISLPSDADTRLESLTETKIYGLPCYALISETNP